MKTILSLAVVAMLIVGLSACGRKAEGVAPTSNNNFEIEKLFTHEGCTMYRFEDVYSRYFMICKDQPSQVEWQENCGKNCQRKVEIHAGRSE